MAKSSEHQKPLVILHVEDSTADAELIERLLVREGLVVDIVRVSTREDFLRGLQQLPIDLILCDYDFPQFHGLTALELARKRRPDVPFIFVSGFMSDDLAAETLRQGAADYLLKDRLARLVPAVRSALREARIRALVSEPPPAGRGSSPDDAAADGGEKS